MILLLNIPAQAQKYFTRDGIVSFSSEAPLETIEATNHKATSVIDMETGRMEIAILVKAFQFEKALMQEHFNENYMESSKFPKALFKGTIQNLDAVNFDQDGEYEVDVTGDLTIHGVTQAVETKGTILIESGAITAQSAFTVEVSDYDIKIPAVVKDNIAKEVAIAVNFNYQLLE